MLKSIYLSACKYFRAIECGDDDYKVIRRKNEEVVGFIHQHEKTKRWLFDPLLVALTAPELMDLSALLGAIRNDYYNNDETCNYEDNP